MPPAGRVILRSRSASSVASVRLPPAESPATSVARAGARPAGPVSTLHPWGPTQSSRPGGTDATLEAGGDRVPGRQPIVGQQHGAPRRLREVGGKRQVEPAGAGDE